MNKDLDKALREKFLCQTKFTKDIEELVRDNDDLNYIDAIVQPGYLFPYNELGMPEGLVKGKKMIVVTSRGGDYSPNTPLHSLDFVEPYLRTIFNFVGIADIHFINAQPMNISLAARRTALLAAIGEARSIISSKHWDAHVPVESIEFPEGVKPAPLSISQHT